MIIGFIHGQGLRISQPLIVADTIDYLEAEFKFLTPDWDGLTKYAHFKLGDSVYDIQLVENKIDKSKHLNLAAGEWEIYLHGNEITDGKVAERITTEIARITVKRTGVLEGEPFPSSIPSISEQILALIGNMEQLDTEAKDTIVNAINEAYHHGGGGGGTANHNELNNRDLADQHPISAITGLEEALSHAGVSQIYKGDTEPTDENILIWIDTSGTSPITDDTDLITSDGFEFYTSDGEGFILQDSVESTLYTSSNEEFIEANNRIFVLN